jgi:CRISPR-associated exonuclease Cas4
MEQVWDDNKLTAEGEILHKNVDNPALRQKDGEIVTLRSVNIASRQLGLYGISDAIELSPSEDVENTITHPKYPGRWRVLPVEYKHGKKKYDKCDEAQVMAQAICLEEQYDIHIFLGAIFYFETRSREYIELTTELRDYTMQCADTMHEIFASQELPKIEFGHRCKNCSLKDICFPGLSRLPSVKTYLKNNLDEETS